MTETLPAALRLAARTHPELDAVVEGDRRISYSELEALATRAGAAFVRAGVERGDRVAIWAPNSTDWIVAYLGLSSAGAVLVPLNTRFVGREAAYILNRSKPKVLLTAGNFLGRDYPSLMDGYDVPGLELRLAFESDGWDSFMKGGDDPGARDELERRVDALGPDDWLDLMWTSGTTGSPKGAASRHGAMLRSFTYYARNLGIVPGDRYLLVNPLFHSFGSKAGVLAAITAAATLYPMAVFDVHEVVRIIERESITVFPGPPTIYYSLLQLPAEERGSLSSLRLAVTGAATVPVELLRRMSEELGFEVVLTAYGLTETGGLVTMCRAGDPLEVVSATCGKPIPDVEVRTVDSDGESTDAGVPGEVVVRGYPVIDGYFEDKEASREAIDADGWFHTGDIGVVDSEGGLKITDRLKDMFIVGGFNAYPAEIESALLEMPAVAQVAVIGIPDDRLGEVGMAFVVERTGETVDPQAVIAFAKGRLANFKVPARVEIVEELPTNAGGKVMKHVLRERVGTERVAS